jgi:uncharacterized protein (TIGR03435 family)
MPTVIARALVLAYLLDAVCLAQQPTFEAVSVKAVKLASHPVFGNSGGPGTTDPGRIHLCCVGMFSLLMRAFDVRIDQIRLDQISGPSWIMDNMGPNLYRIDATMPADTTKAQFQRMMESLLEERFHLEVHHETRNFPAYDLVVAKDGPKLKESTPDRNAVVSDAPQKPKRGADGSLILPPGPQMVTSVGRGMVRVQAQEKPLADLVRDMGNLIAESMGADPTDFAARKARVTDKTGLTGKYDFILEFACEGCRGLGANLPTFGGRADPPPATEPPEGGLPGIFSALEKQLGLRLQKTREVPLDVIVVDRVDKVPTGN